MYIYISYIHICLGSRACPNDLVQRQPSERSITLKSPKGHSRIPPNSWIQALSVHTCDTLGPSANPNVQTAEFKATVRTASWPCCCKGDRSPTAHSKGTPGSRILETRTPIIKQTGLSLGKRALAQGGRPLCPGNRNQRVTSQQDSWKNEYIQKISNRNGRIAHIAGNTYAHPFSTQQAIGTIHIDVYIYKLYTHLPRFTGLSQRPCTTSAVRTIYNAEVAEDSFTMTCS